MASKGIACTRVLLQNTYKTICKIKIPITQEQEYSTNDNYNTITKTQSRQSKYKTDDKEQDEKI